MKSNKARYTATLAACRTYLRTVVHLSRSSQVEKIKQTENSKTVETDQPTDGLTDKAG